MSDVTVPLPVEDLDVLRQRRSAKWRRYPADALPLPVAEMDFQLAPAVRDVLHEAVERGDTGYAWPGDELGRALAGFAAERWGWTIDPDAVRTATDVGVACVDLLRVVARPGDSVVVNPPVYPPFFRWIDEAGTKVSEAPLRQDASGSWRLDLDALAAAFADGAAAYILCNPHNPVGTTHTRDELTEVLRLARRHDVVVISDEIHAPLVLPGATYTPFLTLPGAADIAVSLQSASKAWNLAGLKCGMIVSASPTMGAIVDRRPPDTQWRIGHFGSLAVIAAYTAGVDWLDALIATLDQRRTELAELLAERLPGVRWRPPDATYLAWLDCRAIGDGDQPYRTFLDRGRVELDPGPNFGSPGSGWVRLNFGTSAEILDAAITQMADAVA